jgi:hypothetical protein
MFEAAKILFININNNAKLALCYVNLEQYREAVEAATKANSVSTWKEVCLACLKANEIRLANICGLHIIVHPDHLEDLIGHYERAGKSVELMQLLEQVHLTSALISTTTNQLTFDVINTTSYHITLALTVTTLIISFRHCYCTCAIYVHHPLYV